MSNEIVEKCSSSFAEGVQAVQGLIAKSKIETSYNLVKEIDYNKDEYIAVLSKKGNDFSNISADDPMESRQARRQRERDESKTKGQYMTRFEAEQFCKGLFQNLIKSSLVHINATYTSEIASAFAHIQMLCKHHNLLMEDYHSINENQNMVLEQINLFYKSVMESLQLVVAQQAKIQDEFRIACEYAKIPVPDVQSKYVFSTGERLKVVDVNPDMTISEMETAFETEVNVDDNVVNLFSPDVASMNRITCPKRSVASNLSMKIKEHAENGLTFISKNFVYTSANLGTIACCLSKNSGQYPVDTNVLVNLKTRKELEKLGDLVACE